MNKVEVTDFPELKHRFSHFISKYPLANAVISNLQNGYVYSDTKRNQLFICTKFGWSLLLADDTTEMKTLFNFLRANREIPDYIHLYSPSEAFINFIKAKWSKVKIRKRCQLRYLKKSRTFNYINSLPFGFYIKKIRDLEFSKLDVFNLDFDNRYWQSKDDFIKNAIGACIVNSKNEPVAICYSASIVDKIAEVDILVLSEYRGRSFGSIVSEYFLNLTIEKGVIAHWDTFIANASSFEMAKNLGFQIIQEYELVSIFLRDW